MWNGSRFSGGALLNASLLGAVGGVVASGIGGVPIFGPKASSLTGYIEKSALVSAKSLTTNRLSNDVSEFWVASIVRGFAANMSGSLVSNAPTP